LTVLLAGLAVRALTEATLAPSPLFDALTTSFVQALVFASIFAGLGRALLSPGLPDWRLAPFPDDLIDRTKHYPALIGLVVGVAAFLSSAGSVLGISESTSSIFQCLTNLIELAAIAAALLGDGTIGDRR
jgi:hypothetical protein